MSERYPPDWHIKRQRPWRFIVSTALKFGLAGGVGLSLILFLSLGHVPHAWLSIMGMYVAAIVVFIGLPFSWLGWKLTEAAYRASFIREALRDGQPTLEWPTVESCPAPNFLAVGATPAHVTIERAAQRFAFRGQLTVLVDGEPAGTLGSVGRPLILTVDAGEREFAVRCGRVTGPVRIIYLEPGCHATLSVLLPFIAEIMQNNPDPMVEYGLQTRQPKYGFTITLT